MIRQHLPAPPVARTTRRRREDDELARRAPVAERAADAIAVLQQPRDRALHEDVDARVHGLVLQRADQLQAGAVADVDEAPVRVPAERALRHLAVRRAVEDPAPLLELAHAVGRLLARAARPCASCSGTCRRTSCPGSGPASCPRARRCRATPRRRPRPSRCAPCRAATCRRAPSGRRARRRRSRRAARRRRRRSPPRRSRGARCPSQMILGSSKTPAEARRM